MSLEACIWDRSVLRSKHALEPSLKKYRDLFRDTLEVPDATVDMLITDLLYVSSKCTPMQDKNDYQYLKKLLQEVARLRPNEAELQRLGSKNCWPCRTPIRPRGLSSVGNSLHFYVNDRQNLFEIFSETFPFLDFDFAASGTLKDLLRRCGCNAFLSKVTIIKTEACGSLDYDSDLMEDLRGRANAIATYVILSSDQM